MLPVAVAFCAFIVILSLMLFIKFLKRNVAERQRLARSAALARHNAAANLHNGGYGFTNQVILTNGAAYGNGTSAIMLRHPPLESAAKPFYDIPPPSYEEYDSVPTQLQARSPQPTAPPDYNDLNILPGSIPSSTIQLLEPLSRLQPNVLPQKR